MGEEEGSTESCQFSLAFPHILKRSETVINEILSWRLVSKIWRDAIDLFLENMNWFGDHRMNLASLDKLRTCIPEMESHPGNPFVGRRVLIYTYQRSEEEQDEYWSKCFHLFSKKGEHIHYITLCSDGSPLQFSQLLRELFSRLPNLKEVYFYYWHPDEGYLTRPKEDVYSELASYFETNPFPALESFQMFHFHTRDFPKPIQDAIVSTYGAQLRNIGVCEWDLDYGPMLTNLNDFSLTVKGNSELESLLRLQSPMETFVLMVNIQEVDVALLFQVLESFGETLNSLVLNFPFEATSSSANEVVNLPKLEKLEIRNMNFLSLSFLQGLGASLKQLSLKSEEILFEPSWQDGAVLYCVAECIKLADIITCYNGIDGVNDGEIQIRGCARKMYESNIWELLPKLEVLTLGNNEYEVEDENDIVTKVYTRQMYEYLKRFPAP